MAESSNTLWTDDELREAVEVYLLLLRLALTGLVAADEPSAQRLLAKSLPNRNDVAIRYRMRNVSAVIRDLGGPVLSVFSPAEQVGTGVRRRIIQILKAHPDFGAILSAHRRQSRKGQSPDREAALNRLAALRDRISDLERELIGVGHNLPPEPLTGTGLRREDFAQAQADIAALEVQVAGDPSLNEVSKHSKRLWDFATRLAQWAGVRFTTFVDAALKVAAPIIVAKITNVLPMIVETIELISRIVSR